MIYTVSNLKGGVSKTSAAGSLAELAKQHGQRVLIIDLDSQCDLTFWYRGDLTHAGSYEVITGHTTASEAIQSTPSGIDLISGSANLAGLKTAKASGLRLYKALQELQTKYTAVFIDTGPALNEALYNALTAADRVLIPMEADTNSLQSFYQLADVIKSIQQDRPTVKVSGVFITKYDGRPRINRVLRTAIKDACTADGVQYFGEIRAGICVRECQATQTPLYEYAPRSKPAEDYKALYERIIKAK